MAQTFSRSGFIRTYRFILTLGSLEAGFSNITGLENSAEYDMVQEGGVNGRAHLWVKPHAAVHRLVLETGSGRMNPFLSNRSFRLGMRFEEGGTIVVQSDKKTEGGRPAIARVYDFSDAMVVRWEATTLDAMHAQVSIDRLEIAHSGLHFLQFPLDAESGEYLLFGQKPEKRKLRSAGQP